MRLTEILRPDCIKVPLVATSKQEAIFELVDLLSDRTDIANREELKAAIWQREQTRTTGIGHNIAIPHGKCRGCKVLSMAIGRTARPIDFGAIDNKPVELILLLASPVDQTGPHIQALASISRILTNSEIRMAFKGADSAEAIWELIRKSEGDADGGRL